MQVLHVEQQQCARVHSAHMRDKGGTAGWSCPESMAELWVHSVHAWVCSDAEWHSSGLDALYVL